MQYQVTIPMGSQSVTGVRDFYTFRFLGIRFASQPQRYAFSSVFDGPRNQTALKYGSECVQPDGGSEDCLFVNVFTTMLPLDTTKAKLKPVMVWIHGGGFQTGSNADVNHEGSNLASRSDVVNVMLNYRLGNLGFLAAGEDIKGNYGIQDLITGLEWVKKYVAYFGGDPNQVTIFGESAGAAAIKALLSAPGAKGLFHKAIMQSSPGGIGGNKANSVYPTSADAAKNQGAKILSEIGCSTASNILDCLRAYDANRLAKLRTTAT